MGVEIDNLIKIILGVFVIVAVVGGAFLFFKDYIIDFFSNLIGGEEVPELILTLI